MQTTNDQVINFGNLREYRQFHEESSSRCRLYACKHVFFCLFLSFSVHLSNRCIGVFISKYIACSAYHCLSYSFPHEPVVRLLFSHLQALNVLAGADIRSCTLFSANNLLLSITRLFHLSLIMISHNLQWSYVYVFCQQDVYVYGKDFYVCYGCAMCQLSIIIL